jgi:O-acetyl-ADP-ribose deacetylase (regulator of RNase III)
VNQDESPSGPQGSQSIVYLKGDATAPVGSGPYVIVHICNDLGGWGKGFVLALSKRWRAPEVAYRKWAASGVTFELGMLQIVPVTQKILVANLVAQHGYASRAKPVAVDYEALRACLEKLTGRLASCTTVAMPRIGCGLAGGKWELIEPIVAQTLCARGFRVEVYDLA